MFCLVREYIYDEKQMFKEGFGDVIASYSYCTDRSGCWRQKSQLWKGRKDARSKWVGSDIPTAVILPEIWDVGYVIEESHKYGDPDASQAAKFLGKLALKHKCWFTGGSVLALTDKGAANRAMVIDPSGNYVTSYDKIHLIPLMEEENSCSERKGLSST